MTEEHVARRGHRYCGGFGPLILNDWSNVFLVFFPLLHILFILS